MIGTCRPSAAAPHGCAYCTYPLARGRPRSGTATRGAVVDDLERLTARARRRRRLLHRLDLQRRRGPPPGAGRGDAAPRHGHPLGLPSSGRRGSTARIAGPAASAPGLYAVELGTDAASDTTLAASTRGSPSPTSLAADAACADERIPAAHYVMFGGPGETPETVGEGLANLQRLADAVVFAFFGVRISPGRPGCTALRASRKGSIAPGDSLLRPSYYSRPGVRRPRAGERSIAAAFNGRRDRIFPPSEAQRRLAVMQPLRLPRPPLGPAGLASTSRPRRGRRDEAMQPLDSRRVLLVHPLGLPGRAPPRGDISRKANLMPPLGLAMPRRLPRAARHPADDRRLLRRPRRRRPASGSTWPTERPALRRLLLHHSSFLDGVAPRRRWPRSELPGVTTVVRRPARLGAGASGPARLPGGRPGGRRRGGGDAGRAGGAAAGRAGRDRRASSTGPADGRVVFTGRRPSRLELDSLPFPAYDKLDGYPGAYTPADLQLPAGTPNTSCISSRGCPYACSYCDRSVFGRSFRYNSRRVPLRPPAPPAGALRHPPHQLLRRPVHLQPRSGSRSSAG